jgi:hypothetical protein
MAKYMPQDVFDVTAMAIVFATGWEGPTDEDALIKQSAELWHSYESSYPGDAMGRQHLIEAARNIRASVRGHENSALVADVLHVAIDLRMKLDADMKPVRGLSKIFRGTAFGAGHPTPEIRVLKCAENFKQAFGAALIVLAKQRGILPS